MLNSISSLLSTNIPVPFQENKSKVKMEGLDHLNTDRAHVLITGRKLVHTSGTYGPTANSIFLSKFNNNEFNIGDVLRFSNGNLTSLDLFLQGMPAGHPSYEPIYFFNNNANSVMYYEPSGEFLIIDSSGPRSCSEWTTPGIRCSNISPFNAGEILTITKLEGDEKESFCSNLRTTIGFQNSEEYLLNNPDILISLGSCTPFPNFPPPQTPPAPPTSPPPSPRPPLPGQFTIEDSSLNITDTCSEMSEKDLKEAMNRLKLDAIEGHKSIQKDNNELSLLGTEIGENGLSIVHDIDEAVFQLKEGAFLQVMVFPFDAFEQSNTEIIDRLNGRQDEVKSIKITRKPNNDANTDSDTYVYNVKFIAGFEESEIVIEERDTDENNVLCIKRQISDGNEYKYKFYVKTADGDKFFEISYGEKPSFIIKGKNGDKRDNPFITTIKSLTHTKESPSVPPPVALVALPPSAETLTPLAAPLAPSSPSALPEQQDNPDETDKEGNSGGNNLLAVGAVSAAFTLGIGLSATVAARIIQRYYRQARVRRAVETTLSNVEITSTSGPEFGGVELGTTQPQGSTRGASLAEPIWIPTTDSIQSSRTV